MRKLAYKHEKASIFECDFTVVFNVNSHLNCQTDAYHVNDGKSNHKYRQRERRHNAFRFQIEIAILDGTCD